MLVSSRTDASGIFFLSYAILQVPTTTVFIPRFGATRVLALSMLLWGMAASSSSAVRNEQQLFVLRFLLGVAESGFYPGCLTFLSRWFPDQIFGRALALFSTAASVGGLLAAAGSGLLSVPPAPGLPSYQSLLPIFASYHSLFPGHPIATVSSQTCQLPLSTTSLPS